jgi:hypothetical protein
VLHADDAATESIDYSDIVKTFQAICQHPAPAAASATAAV